MCVRFTSPLAIGCRWSRRYDSFCNARLDTECRSLYVKRESCLKAVRVSVNSRSGRSEMKTQTRYDVMRREGVLNPAGSHFKAWPRQSEFVFTHPTYTPRQFQFRPTRELNGSALALVF